MDNTLPTTAPPGYIGIFSDPEVQAPLDKLYSRLQPEDMGGLALHYDRSGGLTLSMIQRIGGIFSVEFATVIPRDKATMFGLNLQAIKLEAGLVAKW